MAALVGQLLREPGYGNVNPYLSIELGMLDPEGYATTVYDRPAMVAAVAVGRGFSAGAPRVMSAGAMAHSYHDDFYERIHVRPARLDLGNLASAQTRQVFVWNAFTQASQVLVDTDLINGDGITVTAPGALPLTFRPLQERAWEVTVDTQGPPSIDAVLTFEFTDLGGYSARITGIRLNAWIVPPDWGQNVDESLAWLTDWQRAVNGQTTRIPQRDAPRRTWEFSLLQGRRERRIIENLMYDWTARIWALPVWVDVSWLAAPLALGADTIPLDPSGLDFSIGGLAMLWADVQQYELAEVADIAADAIVLARPTVKAWPVGTRVYPCRASRLVDAPVLRRRNDQVIVGRAQFESAEPCDWPAIAPASTYLGIPVLEERADEAEDPSIAFTRDLVIIDGDVGLVEVDDITGLAWPRQTHAWKLYGREQRATHRSLLYWLQGRAQALWLPTWADDVQLLEPVSDASDLLVVAWAGISRYLRQQPGRRHLRVELKDGTVLYRGVTASTELDSEREQLLLSAVTGIAINPNQVRLISWLTLSCLDTDRIEIGHVNAADGIANVRGGFVGDGANEP